MVYVIVPVCAAVKVPEITPVAVLKVSPVGNSGLIVYIMTGPPSEVGTIASIGLPRCTRSDVAL